MFKHFQITGWPQRIFSQTRVTFLNIGIESWFVNYLIPVGCRAFRGQLKCTQRQVPVRLQSVLCQ